MLTCRLCSCAGQTKKALMMIVEMIEWHSVCWLSLIFYFKNYNALFFGDCANHVAEHLSEFGFDHDHDLVSTSPCSMT